MSEKQKWPLAVALEVARALEAVLAPACDRIALAGSARRGKPMVGDVEIVYVSRVESRPEGLFDSVEILLADEVLARLLASGVIDYRLNVNGSRSWGPANKFAVHVATGLPVDFFHTSLESWHNYMVCRTGPSDSNIAIAQAARAKGWVWHPYGSGFSRGSDRRVMGSEREVFEFVGLPYVPLSEFLNPSTPESLPA